MKNKIYCILLCICSFLFLSSQNAEASRSANMPKSTTAIKISLSSAVTKIEDNIAAILHIYNEEGVAGGVAVFAAIKDTSRETPFLSVQYYQGSVTSNPSTTGVVWNNAEAAAANGNYSTAIPLIDNNAIVGYVVVGSDSRPDLDQMAIRAALDSIKKK